MSPAVLQVLRAVGVAVATALAAIAAAWLNDQAHPTDDDNH